jgi:hypothetical protein
VHVTWSNLLAGYDPNKALAEIDEGAINSYLDHRKKPDVPFDDRRKLIYLRHLAATGRHGDSALVAGVTRETARVHARDDADGFGAAKERAIELFRALVIDRTAHKYAIEGWDDPVFYRGEQVGSVHRFCPRTFELYAKRMHPDYREKVQANVDVKGGILVVPGTAPSIEAWLEEARAIEAEHQVGE